MVILLASALCLLVIAGIVGLIVWLVIRCERHTATASVPAAIRGPVPTARGPVPATQSLTRRAEQM